MCIITLSIEGKRKKRKNLLVKDWNPVELKGGETLARFQSRGIIEQFRKKLQVFFVDPKKITLCHVALPTIYGR
jgi:hypothetical protein